MNENAADRPDDAQRWHPDAETLACLAQDLLDPAESARLRSHVADCADCQLAERQVLELSVAVTELLASAPPEPMPDLVADRLDAALAALGPPGALAGSDAGAGVGTGVGAGADAGAPGDARPTGTAAGHAPVVPLDQARRRRRGLVLAAAASVLVVAGVATGVNTLAGPGTPQAEGPATPSPATTQPPSPRPSGGGQFASALPYRVSSSGYSYDPDGFDTAVDKLLASGAPTGEGTGSGTIGPRTDPGTGSPRAGQATPTVPACVLETPRQPDQPVAIDFGSFKGTRAAVLVYTDRAHKNQVRAFVVAVDCSGVLFEQVVAR
jgi:hypothetical protein